MTDILTKIIAILLTSPFVGLLCVKLFVAPYEKVKRRFASYGDYKSTEMCLFLMFVAAYIGFCLLVFI